MFLRFYAQSEGKIQECIDKLKPVLPPIRGIRKEPITQSIRSKLPVETELLKNVQVVLIFWSPEDEQKARESKEGLEIYKQYSSGEPVKNVAVISE